MNRFIFANPKLCVGCDACVDACAEAHQAAGLQPQSRMYIVRNGEISTPITCRHCENAPCATICPVNAITMAENSVALDEAACIGCKLCAIACPFGVIGFSDISAKASAANQDQKDGAHAKDASTKVAGMVAVKCDLCESAKDGPACIKSCATKALFLVDAKSLRRSDNAKRKAAVNNMPEFEPLMEKKA